MSDPSFLLLASLVLAGLFTVVLPYLWRRLKRRWHRARDVTPPAPGPAMAVPYAGSAAPPRREAPKPARRPAAPAALPARRRWPVENLREARRGMVLRTVLGPCRALEPPDAER